MLSRQTCDINATFGWRPHQPLNCQQCQTGGMSFVAINVISVPADKAETLEARFAARRGSVDKSPGFEHFELLRPITGTEDYLVYTRWQTEDHFNQWRESRDFASGHGKPSASESQDSEAEQRPVATDATLWTFEVA